MTATTMAEQFFIDAMSPAFRDDPYPHYASYRSEVPLLAMGDGLWFSFTHTDVSALLRHPRMSSDERRSKGYAQAVLLDPAKAARPQPPSLLFLDPPDHTRLRALVARAFTAKVVDRLRADADAMVTELLDDLAEQAAGGEPVDLVATLAYPLPVRIICALLGVPHADEATFTAWSHVLARSIDPEVLRSDEINAQIEVADGELTIYVEELVRDRAGGGRSGGDGRDTDDLLSTLLTIEGEGDRITLRELIDLAMLLLVAGHETTVNLIGNGTLALLRNPTERARLLADPGLVEGAVDELLRFDSPVQMSQRTAIEDLEIAGQLVEKGDQVVLVLGAANRDPATFTEPNRLDVTRDARRRVGFGGGIHHCLGAALARMEATVALQALLARFPDMELAGDPVRRPTFTLRGIEQLPVRVG